jgi:hypothetical protein
MTIYDLLRRLLPGPSWQDYEVAEATRLIGELEQLNVFGTAAGTVMEQHEHELQPIHLPGSDAVARCRICGKDFL